MKDVVLNGEVVFAYGDSMHSDVQNKRDVDLGDVYLLSMFNKKDSANNNVSRNTVTVEMAGKQVRKRSMDS